MNGEVRFNPLFSVLISSVRPQKRCIIDLPVNSQEPDCLISEMYLQREVQIAQTIFMGEVAVARAKVSPLNEKDLTHQTSQ